MSTNRLFFFFNVDKYGILKITSEEGEERVTELGNDQVSYGDVSISGSPVWNIPYRSRRALFFFELKKKFKKEANKERQERKKERKKKPCVSHLSEICKT